MHLAEFENDGATRSTTISKWIGAPSISSYLVALTIAAGLVFAWVGLCAI
jgi:hypothetical protein